MKKLYTRAHPRVAPGEARVCHCGTCNCVGIYRCERLNHACCGDRGVSRLARQIMPTIPGEFMGTVYGDGG